MIVLGTAGHIDHGKTTLVRCLTGIDTDRLPIEKERGITTELGFAHLDLLDGTTAAIIDVPGHERFVRHMIAGAGGIDLAVLVVAADEGVMPQTREHLDILGLVGVQSGFVVLTRCDLIPAEDVVLAREDVASALQGTFMAGAPMLEFAAPRLQELAGFRLKFIETVKSLVPCLPQRPSDRPFRMGIDRVFVAAGFGAVATGTVTAGSLRTGDQVVLLPSGSTARIRSIQQHGQQVDSASAGMRVALNLQGLNAQTIPRGEVVTSPEGMRTGRVLDVSVTLLARIRKPFKRRTACTVHLGTRMISGHVVLLDSDSLEPGAQAIGQLRLSEPVAALAGESFVIRGFDVLEGFGRTLGGGVVLRPDAPVRRKSDVQAISWLREMTNGDTLHKVLACIELSGSSGATVDELLAIGPVGRSQLVRAVSTLNGTGRISPFLLDGRTRYIGPEVLAGLAASLLSALAKAHEHHPERSGATVELLRGLLPSRPPCEALEVALRFLAASQQVVAEGTTWRLPAHSTSGVRLGSMALERVSAFIRAAGLSAPPIQEVAVGAGLAAQAAKDALQELVGSGIVVRVSGDLHFDALVLEDVQRRLLDFLASNGRITTAQLKDLLATTRRTAIPLAEWFDSKHVTIRLPDGQRKRFGC